MAIMNFHAFKANPLFPVVLRTVIAVAFTTASVAFFTISIQSSAKKIAQQQLELRRAQARLEAAATIRAQHKQFEPLLQNITNLLLTEEEVLTFVKLLEDTALETGNQITVRFVGTGVAVPSQDVPELSVVMLNISINGSEQSFLDFLAEFNRFPHLAQMRSMDIEGERGITASSVLKADIALFLRQSETTQALIGT